MAERKQSKRVIGMRADERTCQKIEDLREVYGTKTTALTLAIDRLWCSEFPDRVDSRVAPERDS